MEKEHLLHGELTEQIINSFFHVYNQLGFGFLEKVYENSLVLTLRSRGFRVEQQFPIDVLFEGQLVGNYFADLLIDNPVIVELKANQALAAGHEAQLLNYLRATDIEVGLLLNFGTATKFRRVVMSNGRKPDR